MVLSKKSLKKLRMILLEITPEITAILDDFILINKMRGNAEELSDEEAADKGIEIIKEFLDMLLVRQYDSIVKILSALYEIAPGELEEKEIGEIMEMAIGTLSDEGLVRFFPQLGLLARRMQYAIYPKLSRCLFRLMCFIWRASISMRLFGIFIFRICCALLLLGWLKKGIDRRGIGMCCVASSLMEVLMGVVVRLMLGIMMSRM